MHPRLAETVSPALYYMKMALRDCGENKEALAVQALLALLVRLLQMPGMAHHAVDGPHPVLLDPDAKERSDKTRMGEAM